MLVWMGGMRVMRVKDPKGSLSPEANGRNESPKDHMTVRVQQANTSIYKECGLNEAYEALRPLHGRLQ